MERRRKSSGDWLAQDPNQVKTPPSQERASDPLVVNSQRLIPLSLERAEALVHFLLKQANRSGMCLYFVGKQRISSLHLQFFGDPTSTDCISFPYDDPLFLGEVFVCPQVAREYTVQHGGDLYEELTLYVVHGFLHLMGFEDLSFPGVELMRKEEKKWMTAILQNDLYLRP